jgi:hypothetical protein
MQAHVPVPAIPTSVAARCREILQRRAFLSLDPLWDSFYTVDLRM